MGVISFLLLIGLCIHVNITRLHKDEIKDLRDENEELRKENVKKREAFTKQNKNGVLWSQTRMRIEMRLRCFLVI